ncbi:MAG: energy-coupling factor transporter ATPase [Mogibacterium sp.]|nr:energy-coupling factor transporter ATPase [Mogibacterium sp.]
MAFIEVRDLVVEFTRITEEGVETAGKRAVDGVSLDVERGSFVSVIGMNGSGKSTMAKCLNGLIIPTSGTVTVDGMDTRDDSRIWDIRRRVGMVFQNPDNQIVSSIVEDDVAFGPENLGIPPAEIRERVDRALKQVNMYEHRLKGAHMLSGGQKQRIAIAGAVAMRPDCIVFDEPTAMLDPKGRESVMSIIRQLNSEGITAILITHFMSEAAQADRIVVLKNGKVLADRTPREIFSDRELIRDAGLELPPVIQLREELGMPDSVMTAEDMIDELRKQCQ